MGWMVSPEIFADPTYESETHQYCTVFHIKKFKGVLKPLDNFIDLHLKPHVLTRLGLPEMPYTVPAHDMNFAWEKDGELPVAAMLLGLQ